MISFTFDDGYASTFTRAAPILRDFGMPATVGVICNRLFWQREPRFMGVDELRQLVNAGWEVASHSLFHRWLPKLPPSYDDEKATWRYDTAADAFVAACPWGDVGTVVYEGEYLKRLPSFDRLRELRSGFVHQPKHARIFARCGDSRNVGVDLRFGSAEREISESQKILKSSGFDINSFIVPFSQWPIYLHQYGSRYYDLVASVRSQPNIYGFVNRDGLSRFAVAKDRSAEAIMERIEGHLQRQSWSIICFHDLVEQPEGTYDWSVSEFLRLIKWVSERNVSVHTLTSGFKHLKNIHLDDCGAA